MISKLAVFDIRNATAFNPDDIEKIFALIRAMPGNGFVTINSQIKGQCAWLAGAFRLRLPQFSCCKRPLTRCVAWLVRLFLLSAVRGWVVTTARGAVELARTERGEARTEHDCRMLLSYCRLLVEMRREQEAHALCVEGLRLAGGLEVVLDHRGVPTGEFVDARTHEATQRLLAELKAAQERGDDTVRVLEASGRAVCDAHFDVGAGEKSRKTVKAVVLIKKSGGTQLTVLYGQVAAMDTVPADWVLGGGWREDALVFDADGASAGGGGALGAGHPVVLHLKALLTDTVAMDGAGKDAMWLELIAAWQRCGALERAQIRCLAAFLLALA